MQTLSIVPQLPFPIEQQMVQTTRPQPRKRTQKIHYEPTLVDYEIFKYVWAYYFLTAWQLVDLHYAAGSKTRAQTKLQILSGNSEKVPSEPYLHRRALHHISIGNPTYIYSLATDGLNYLKRHGFTATTRRFRPSEAEQISFPHLEHALNVNDILIAARNLSKAAPDIRLETWLHDFDLQKTPATVELDRRLKGGGIETERVKIIPDGMLDFRLTLANSEKKDRRRILLPEIDRGTETNIDEFKKKIRAYVHYAYPDGAFEQRFGDVDKRVVWIVTRGGENRLYTIRKWCEDELEEQHLEHEYNLFRFTKVDHVIDSDTGKIREALAVEPHNLFLSPVAYRPFQEQPSILLWKP